MKRAIASLIVLGIATLSFTQSKAPSLFSILGKSRKDVEATIGKPDRKLKVEPPYDANYSYAEGLVLSASYESGKLESLTVSFSSKPKDWKAALKTLGMNTAGAKGADMKGDAGWVTTTITGVKGLPKTWEMMYMPNGPKAQLSMFSPKAR